MSFRRIPKEIDPRRPPKRGEQRAEVEDEGESKARSYGQYIEVTPEELAELEAATDEVAREGSSSDADDAGEGRATRQALEDREAFEEATDEVSREDGPSR